MYACLQIQAPLIVTHASYTRDGDAQVAEYSVGTVIAVISHQLSDITCTILPDPFSNPWQVLVDWRNRITTVVAAVLKWSATPEAITVQTELLLPRWAKR